MHWTFLSATEVHLKSRARGESSESPEGTGSAHWTISVTGSSEVRLDPALTTQRPRTRDLVHGHTGLHTFTFRSTSCTSCRCHSGRAHCVQPSGALGTAPPPRHRFCHPRQLRAPQFDE